MQSGTFNFHFWMPIIFLNASMSILAILQKTYLFHASTNFSPGSIIILPSNESSHGFLSHCFIILPWFFTVQITLDLHPSRESLFFTPRPGSDSFSNLSFSETLPDPIRASFRARSLNFKISFSLASSLALALSISHCTNAPSFFPIGGISSW